MQALVRYGPEISGLVALMRQAEDQRRMSIRQARGSARGMRIAVDQAAPRVRQIYEDAGLGQARTAETLMHKDLAGLGAGADPFKAAGAVEAQAQAERLRAAQAGALGELDERRVQAAQGRQFAVQAAQDQYRSDVGKITQRQQDLAREQGAFTAATIGDLKEAARDRRVTIRGQNVTAETSRQNARQRTRQQERSSLRSAGIDPDTGSPIPGGKLDPQRKKKFKPASPAEYRTASQQVGFYRSWAERYKNSGNPRRVPKLDFVRGVKPNSENPEWPTIPAAKDELFVNIALDLAYDGRVSKRNARLLRSRGITLKRLGVPGPLSDAQRKRNRRAADELDRAVQGALLG